MSIIRLAIVDDHALFRGGVRSIVEQMEEVLVVGEAADGTELRTLLEDAMPEVVLLDISMPGLSGLDALEEIKDRFPRLRVIVLTMHEESEYVERAARLGVKGYLPKNVEPEELRASIRKVMQGETAFHPRMAQRLFEAWSTPAAAKPTLLADLTDREQEVLRLVADGLSTKMIAEQLSISPRTVETHRINLTRKLGAANTAEAIGKAHELGLLKK